MKQTHAAIILFLIIVIFHVAPGQGREKRLRTKGYVNPEEIVSLDSSLTLDQAFAILDTMSEKFVGKIIDYPGEHTNRIGVYIEGQQWHDAMETILRASGLWYKEEARLIRIFPAEGVVTGGPLVSAVAGAGGKPEERPPTLESRDIRISAVFFTVNVSKAQSYGISWNFFRAKPNEPTMDVYANTGIGIVDTLAAGVTRPTRGPFESALGTVTSAPSFTFANIDALVKFFGQNQLGEVTTSPDVTVRNGKEGKIQVGSTIFITTKDIAGNTIQQPVETGTIVDVIPTIYNQSDTDFVYLNLKIEQSSVEAGPVINKNRVETHALLYDGEETVIGGLITTTETETREGIPILKDLPWWFFGLRYLFGSESKSKGKEELVILLKAELSHPIRQRILEKPLNPENLIDKRRKEYNKEYEK